MPTQIAAGDSRRRGRTIALIGADGAGKTTIARRMTERLPGRVVYLYSGINPDASVGLLPTTRLIRTIRRRLGRPTGRGGPPRAPRPKTHRRSPVSRAVGAARGWLRLVNLMAEEWYRQALERRALRREATVIMDRSYFFDYYLHDVSDDRDRSLPRRFHGAFLRLLRRPDATILLDAPPAVLFARKPEGTFDDVVRRRQEYLEIARRFPEIVTIDATRPTAEVEADIARIAGHV